MSVNLNYMYDLFGIGSGRNGVGKEWERSRQSSLLRYHPGIRLVKLKETMENFSQSATPKSFIIRDAHDV